MREYIPILRNLIIEITQLAPQHVINANSYYKSSLNAINGDGTQKITDFTNFIIFELTTAGIKYAEQDKTNFDAVFNLEIYGTDAQELALKIYNHFYNKINVNELIKNKIAITKILQNFNTYETINGSLWNKTIMEMRLNLEYQNRNYMRGDDDFIDKAQIKTETK